MTASGKNSIDLGFNPSIAQTAIDDFEAAKNFPDRIKPFGVMLLLGGEPGGLRSLRTAEIAKRFKTTESTMYRHIAKPALETLLAVGRESLVKDHRDPRFAAIKAFALDLTFDISLNIEVRISRWSAAYATTANPSHLYVPFPDILTRTTELVGPHAQLIDVCISSIVGSDAQLQKGAGLRLTPIFGALDMTPVEDSTMLTPEIVEYHVMTQLAA